MVEWQRGRERGLGASPRRVAHAGTVQMVKEGKETSMSRGVRGSMLAWPALARQPPHWVCGRRVGLGAGIAEHREEAGQANLKG